MLEGSVGFTETLEKAREIVDRDAGGFAPRLVKQDVVRARGVASMFYGVSLGAIGRAIDRGTAKVEILEDGSVSVFIGCTDMGQGAQTVIAQIAADTLGLGLGSISVHQVDTGQVPDSGPTVASRTTVMSGNAVIDACLKIRRQILEVVASALGSEVAYLPAEHALLAASGRRFSMEEAIRECCTRGATLSAEGRYDPPVCSVDKETGQGKAYYVYSFATDVAEIEVDTRTGHIDVVSLAAIHDSGAIVNPLTASSQIEGGVAQGIGLALRENFVQAGGRVVSGDLSTYLVPTSLDACDCVRSEFIQCDSKDGPFGAKGLGEPAIIPVAAAIANAVSNALGTRVRSLPISPEWVCGKAPTWTSNGLHRSST
jgi:CO/xanthine dehydrogenase Mo-binding subunit